MASWDCSNTPRPGRTVHNMSSLWDIYQEDQETKQCQIDVFQIFQITCESYLAFQHHHNKPVHHVKTCQNYLDLICLQLKFPTFAKQRIPRAHLVHICIAHDQSFDNNTQVVGCRHQHGCLSHPGYFQATKLRKHEWLVSLSYFLVDTKACKPMADFWSDLVMA